MLNKVRRIDPTGTVTASMWLSFQIKTYSLRRRHIGTVTHVSAVRSQPELAKTGPDARRRTYRGYQKRPGKPGESPDLPGLLLY